MVTSLARRIYSNESVKTLLRKAGVDYHVRSIYTRLEELAYDDKEIEIADVSFTVSSRTYRKNHDELVDGAEGEVLRDLLEEIQKDDIFWDIGADKGIYTLPIGHILPAKSIVPFEPHPIRRGELERNLKRNRLSIEIRTEALSDDVGSAQLEYGLKHGDGG